MKRDKHKQTVADMMNQESQAKDGDFFMQQDNSEMNELEQIKKDVEQMYEVPDENKDNMFNDKVMTEIKKNNIYLTDF